MTLAEEMYEKQLAERREEIENYLVKLKKIKNPRRIVLVFIQEWRDILKELH